MLGLAQHLFWEEVTFDERAPNRRVTIDGSLYDEAGVTQLIINGQSISIQEGVEVLFTKSLAMRNGELALVAQDRLGNRTAANIPIRTGLLEQGHKQGKAFGDIPRG